MPKGIDYPPGDDTNKKSESAPESYSPEKLAEIARQYQARMETALDTDTALERYEGKKRVKAFIEKNKKLRDERLRKVTDASEEVPKTVEPVAKVEVGEETVAVSNGSEASKQSTETPSPAEEAFKAYQGGDFIAGELERKERVAAEATEKEAQSDKDVATTGAEEKPEPKKYEKPDWRVKLEATRGFGPAEDPDLMFNPILEEAAMGGRKRMEKYKKTRGHTMRTKTSTPETAAPATPEAAAPAEAAALDTLVPGYPESWQRVLKNPEFQKTIVGLIRKYESPDTAQDTRKEIKEALIKIVAAAEAESKVVAAAKEGKETPLTMEREPRTKKEKAQKEGVAGSGMMRRFVSATTGAVGGAATKARTGFFGFFGRAKTAAEEHPRVAAGAGVGVGVAGVLAAKAILSGPSEPADRQVEKAVRRMPDPSVAERTLSKDELPKPKVEATRDAQGQPQAVQEAGSSEQSPRRASRPRREAPAAQESGDYDIAGVDAPRFEEIPPFANRHGLTIDLSKARVYRTGNGAFYLTGGNAGDYETVAQAFLSKHPSERVVSISLKSVNPDGTRNLALTEYRLNKNPREAAEHVREADTPNSDDFVEVMTTGGMAVAASARIAQPSGERAPAAERTEAPDFAADAASGMMSLDEWNARTENSRTIGNAEGGTAAPGPVGSP